jgi:carbon storage regulator
MLVLGRRPGESLVIDGDIRITILEVEGERVRIGIDAPRSVPIVRQELYDAVHAENLHATNAPIPGAALRSLGRAPSPAGSG